MIMRRIQRTPATLGLIGSSLLVAGLGVGATFVPLDDYERLPPAHEVVEKAIKDQNIALRDAIDVASKMHADAVVASASFDVAGSRATGITIDLFTKGEKRRVKISPADGSILSDEKVPHLPGWACDGEWVTTETGLRYCDIVPGAGRVPPRSSTTVKVHYSGWLVDGTPFDSSMDRGQPIDFPLNRVIPGWTEGVGSMRVGGKRKLVIPFELAYGPRGRAPSIPPRATLIFDVELIDIVAD